MLDFMPCSANMEDLGIASECVVFTDTDIIVVSFMLDGSVEVEVC